MKNKKTAALYCIVLIFISCSKQAIENHSITQNSISNSTQTCSSGKWFGVYGNANPPYQYDSVRDRTFISDSVAYLNHSPFNYYFTSEHLVIPGCHVFNGDNAKMEVRIKNPDNNATSIADYDVSISMVGAVNTAHITFTSNVDYTSAGVGGTQRTRIGNLKYLFEEYSVISLQTNSNKLTFYKDGALLGSIRYSNYDSIGVVKSIVIGCKGAGLVDWVKLYTVKPSKQIMEEDFNVPGSSSILWF